VDSLATEFSRGKSKMNVAVVYILVSVLAGAAGQLLLKRGMGSMGPLTLSAGQLFPLVWRLATNPFVVIGLAVYMGGTLFWLTALSRVDLSYAYPFASLSYLVMLVAAWRLFGEDISALRILGSLVIMLGVFLISRS
jgi:drug/metabolite transporter (DMT)-like permease